MSKRATATLAAPPDVWKAYKDQVQTELIELDKADGGIHAVNACYRRRELVVTDDTCARRISLKVAAQELPLGLTRRRWGDGARSSERTLPGSCRARRGGQVDVPGAARGVGRAAASETTGLMRSSHKLPDATGAAEVKEMLGARGWLGVALALTALGGLRMGEVRAFEVQQAIRRWSFHSLRQHFISELIRRGAGLLAVRVLAGHCEGALR